MKYQGIQTKYLLALKELKEAKKDLKLMYRGIQYGFLIIFVVILVVYGLSGNIVLAQTQDVDFTWEENILYDDSLTATESGFNREVPKQYGNYSGTWSFDGEIGFDPSDWEVSEVDSDVRVIDDYLGHHSILSMTDDNSVGYPSITMYNVNLTYGSVEWWWLNDDTSKGCFAQFAGLTGGLFFIYIDDNKFSYYNGSFIDIGVPASSNTWYHMRVDFDCGTSQYSDLDQYNWKVFINNTEYGDFDFIGNQEKCIQVRFANDIVDISAVGYSVYVDAIGYYPNYNYSVGENIDNRIFSLIAPSLPLHYEMITYDDYEIIGDINATHHLGGERMVMKPHFFAGFYTLKIDFVDWKFPIYNISDIMISYNITMNTTATNPSLALNVEQTYNQWNFTTGLDLYGINESIGFFPDDLVAYDVWISISAESEYEIWLDYLRFDYNLLVDKYEFGFNSTGHFNAIGDDDVNEWTDIEGVYNYPDVVNCYYSDDSLDRSIRLYSNGDGWAGIEKTFTHQFGTYYNVSWQLDVNHWGRGGHIDSWHDVIIYSYDQTEIFHLRIEGYSYVSIDDVVISHGDAYYYNGSEYIWLADGIEVQDDLDFSLFWVHNDYDNFTFIMKGIEYSVPSIDNTKTGLGKIKIQSFVDDYVIWQYIDYEIDSVGIHIDGIPYNDDGYTTQLYYYLDAPTWYFAEHNFIEFQFDPLFNNNISIYINGYYELIEFEETFGLLYYWKNLYNESLNFPYPFLEIYNGTGVSGYGDIHLKIYGVMLVNQLNSNEVIPSFSYSNIDIQQSYFYVDNNQLEYTLTTNDVGAEYIQIDLDITDYYSVNKSFAINHRKSLPNLFAEIKVIYTDSTFSYFESETSLLYESTILPQDKIIDSFQFLITDNDNDYYDTMTGHFSDITLIYYPNIDTLLPIINFIAIIPILVILFIIPMYIYIRFKKSWVFLPMVMLFAIIGTGAGIIPLWLTVVIIFSIISFYLIQRKATGG